MSVVNYCRAYCRLCLHAERGRAEGEGGRGDIIAGSGTPCSATGEEAGVENGVGSWSWDPAVGTFGVEKGGCTRIGVG